MCRPRWIKLTLAYQKMKTGMRMQKMTMLTLYHLKSVPTVSFHLVWLPTIGIGPGHPPASENSTKRRVIYRKIWGGYCELRWMANTLVHPEEKKNVGGAAYVHHKRDVMPGCVVKLARNLYPNLKNKEYMVHKWEWAQPH